MYCQIAIYFHVECLGTFRTEPRFVVQGFWRSFRTQGGVGLRFPVSPLSLPILRESSHGLLDFLCKEDHSACSDLGVIFFPRVLTCSCFPVPPPPDRSALAPLPIEPIFMDMKVWGRTRHCSFSYRTERLCAHCFFAANWLYPFCFLARLSPVLAIWCSRLDALTYS